MPLDARYAHDLDAMLARVDASVGLVYICNPNNPTGTLTSRQGIEEFLRRLPPEVHVVIDQQNENVWVFGPGTYNACNNEAKRLQREHEAARKTNLSDA